MVGGSWPKARGDGRLSGARRGGRRSGAQGRRLDACSRGLEEARGGWGLAVGGLRR